MVSWFSELISIHEGLIIILGSLSLFTFAASLLTLPVLLIRIPSDYFLETYKARRRYGVSGLLFHIVKNFLGVVFIIMGFIMLFIPGQGLLTILAGMLVMDIPGKRKLELRLIQNRTIYRSIDAIRKKAGKDSLKVRFQDGSKGV